MFLCPECLNQADHRTVKGAIRYYVCHTCNTTFKTEERIISSEEQVANAKDKVRDYLKTRKTPATASDLAKYFALGRETIAKALRELEQEGFAQRHRLASGAYWTKLRSVAPLAVPKQTAKPIRFIPPHVKQSSYAHVRGYDD